MKSSPRSTVMNMICGSWLSQCIYVSVKLKIADFLSETEGIGIDKLIKLTGTHEDALSRLLDILCEFDFCYQRDKNFYLTPQGKLLQSNAPDSLYAYVILNTELYSKIWGNLLQSVKTGVPAYKTVLGPEFFSSLNEKFPSEAKYYDMAMDQKYKAHNELIAKSYDKFSIFKSVVDVGGGMGGFLTTVLNHHPQLTGVLVDLPPVISRASQKIHDSKAINQERIAFIGSDIFKSVPKASSPTLYVLKAVLHDWDDEKALMILKNCKKAMTEKDTLLVIEKSLTEKEKNSHQPLMNLHMFLIHGGNERKLSELLTLISSAGFKCNESITSLDDGTKLVEATPRIRSIL